MAVEVRTLHYCSAGTGKPAVVLEAGIPGVGRETISFEFPVHVLSFRTGAERRIGDQADGLGRFLPVRAWDPRQATGNCLSS